jgi:hypothetical protein
MSVTQTGTALIEPNIGSYFGHSTSVPRLPPEQWQKQTQKSLSTLHVLFFTTVT